MNREDDQKLWDLLGHAAAPKASPFFARNVLRRLREEPLWIDRLLTFIPMRRLVPIGAGVAAALVAAFLFLNPPKSPENVAGSDEIVEVDEQDYDVIADLDNLLAMEESSLWDDDTSSL